MNEQSNRILGAGTARAIGDASGAGMNICGEACAQGEEPNRPRYVSAVVEVRATRSFGDAFSELRGGARITRAGWNAAGQYVHMQWPDKNSRMTVPYAVLKNAQGDLVPWLPSQGDLFANDWAVLPI